MNSVVKSSVPRLQGSLYHSIDLCDEGDGLMAVQNNKFKKAILSQVKKL